MRCVTIRGTNKNMKNREAVNPENNAKTDRKEGCLSINEVAEMFGVNVWTLRLWANRFDILKPYRDKKGDIVFTLSDVDRIGTICRLTKKKGITLEDIRKRLEAE